MALVRGGKARWAQVTILVIARATSDARSRSLRVLIMNHDSTPRGMDNGASAISLLLLATFAFIAPVAGGCDPVEQQPARAIRLDSLC